MRFEGPTCAGPRPAHDDRRNVSSWWKFNPRAAAAASHRIAVAGEVVALYSPNMNINHAFHEDLWSVLSYMRHSEHRSSATVVSWVATAWLSDLLHAAAELYGWRLLTPSSRSSWVCAEGPHARLLLNGRDSRLGFDRHLLPEIKEELRRHVLRGEPAALLSGSGGGGGGGGGPQKERVVIYSRLSDSSTRQLHGAEAVAALFDAARFNVSVAASIPAAFAAQARFFGSASLLVAPNGGWAPNVLWLPRHACLVEVHMYRTSSWIKMFGLAETFLTDRFLLVTGDYHNASAPRMPQNPKRIGGDDAIQGSRLKADLRAVLARSAHCRRFLRRTA